MSKTIDYNTKIKSLQSNVLSQNGFNASIAFHLRHNYRRQKVFFKRDREPTASADIKIP